MHYSNLHPLLLYRKLQPLAIESKNARPLPKVTVLADLPDSLQPVVTYLKDLPEPETRVFSIPPPAKTFIDSVTRLPLPPELHGRGFFTNYTSDDGLANDAVHSSFMDKAGQLWFGTISSGVARFDGKSFTTFTTEHGLASNTVWEIMEDKSGNLWFGTFNGLSRYDGRTFINFTTAQGLPHNDNIGLFEDSAGNLWIATMGGGISRYDGKSFTNFNEENGFTNIIVTCIEQDNKGTLWFGTRLSEVFHAHYQSEETVSFTRFDGQERWENDWITFIHEDRDGGLWFGTQTSGLSRLDLGAGDSLIVRTIEYQWLRTFRSGDSTGTFDVHEGLSFLFQSDNSTNGEGFSVKFRKMYNDPNQPEPMDFTGNTFYFDAGKGALQSGSQASQTPFVGKYATGLGYRNQSNGDYSTGLGYKNLSYCDYSTGIGYLNDSYGDYAIAIGSSNYVNGDYGTAIGSQTDAHGYRSTALGAGCSAVKDYSMATGVETASYGRNSTTEEQVTIYLTSIANH